LLQVDLIYSDSILEKALKAMRHFRDDAVMRLLSVLLVAISSAAVYSANSAASESNIRKILTTAKSWTMYLEFTDAPLPSDRAQRFGWEYFERDGKVWGRRVPRLAFGDCDSEISLRADGFSFRWCDPQLGGGEPSLNYDPNDPKYPFKNREPRKLWLQATD
jgi:hypothetical protein